MRLAFPRPWVIATVPSAYFAAATFAIYLTGQAGNIAALWFATAIVLTALIRHPVATWPILLLLSAGADVAANLLMGSKPAAAIGVAAADALEPLLVAAAMHRFGGGKLWFMSGRWMALFAGFSIVGSAAAALLGSGWLALLGEAPFATTLRLWLFADALGLVIVTPFLLSWTEPALKSDLTAARVSEAFLLTGLVAAIAYYDFTHDLPFLFTVFPFLMLVTFRTGLPGATAGAVALSAIAMWFTLNGLGPIGRALDADPVERIQIMQLYLLVVLLSALPIAVTLAQRGMLAVDLKKQNLISSAAMNNMSQGLSMFDAESRLVTCNRRFAALYGLPPELARPGTSLQDLLGHGQARGDFSEQILRDMRAVVARREPTGFSFELKDGRVFLVLIEPMSDGGWVATHQDITERRRKETKIAYMARHDALTDLPNRIFLREQLDEALVGMKRKDDPLAVLCLDLDRFKAVNDTLGHPAGDDLLRRVARRLKACVRETDVVARLGGDEFAILQRGCDQPRNATILARRIVEEISRSYDIGGSQAAVGASLGVSLAPGDGLDPDLLLRKADLALYRAKAQGRGTYRFFEAEMDAQVQARRSLELDLRKALAAGELQLYYQPLVTLSSNRVAGFEALMRWSHPKRGFVPPAEFIPLAEEIGLIVPLGEWAIRQACSDAAAWPDDVKIAVNLSPAQFTVQNSLIQVVMNALAASGLPPGRLELEITETVLLDESAATMETLHSLRALGVRISLDDFGTGYSSLSYLRKFPFDKIKIDRSFVHELASRGECHAIVHAVVGLATALGMATTAEGVETQEQLDQLRIEGCTEAQGFLFSPARPASEAARLMESCNAQAGDAS